MFEDKLSSPRQDLHLRESGTGRPSWLLDHEGTRAGDGSRTHWTKSGALRRVQRAPANPWWSSAAPPHPSPDRASAPAGHTRMPLCRRAGGSRTRPSLAPEASAAPRGYSSMSWVTWESNPGSRGKSPVDYRNPCDPSSLPLESNEHLPIFSRARRPPTRESDVRGPQAPALRRQLFNCQVVLGEGFEPS